ncbi:outer membrane protein assembly factor BamD [Marinobacter sp. TBZ242]|uniref:Outer membrane protein assembly factor BamD n=1 Tax=Marinobacter azerbaijanicus TaxID=3050455 RepID=A0ABT7I6D9_9GAMM|nr:outer membrane protein assembly factor BamD [Marinobacter sp. TBZ242]MDL0429677.1 outer membrane protein assembly factor BamD [Marinobacter sp. TBZ242]
MKRLLIVALGLAVYVPGPAAMAQESFRVELGRDGETIGDMRPVFLEFKSRPMPAISPREVARRYQRLFDNSDEPEVRIDALNRLSNIQKATNEDVSFSNEREQQVYQQALDSYEAILDRGSYQGRLDELLYQMAKAHAYTGQAEESIDRLRQLVGLYPSSTLVPEARFRIAEAAFSAGDYAVAESEYSRVISGEGSDSLKTKARYMQGWSQYKQGPAAWDRSGETFMAVLDRFDDETDSFRRIPTSDAGLVEDTFRIMALMAAEDRGADSLDGWLNSVGGRDYGYLLYDRLADYYASNTRYEDAVEVNRHFVGAHGNHASVPAFLSQNVDVWLMAGRTDRAREARAEYVRSFAGESRYQSLARSDQGRWQEFSRLLADYHYDQAENAGADRRREQFRLAADYYRQLAARVTDPGEVLRLSGDAFLQAGEYRQALNGFQQAAYDTSGYQGAADAAWAAIVLQRKAVDGHYELELTLDELASEAERLAKTFPGDRRLPGLNADIANRMLARNRRDDALKFAEAAIAHPAASAGEQYSAWLVSGEAFVGAESYGLAENAWRKSLALLNSGALPDRQDEDRRSLQRQLAGSIYQQGEQAANEGRTDQAVAHYQRVESVLAGSDIAIKGRYDAANTLLQAERWQAAVNELNRFRADYPQHELAGTVSEKLVFAYQSSGQPVRAADELMAEADGNAPTWEQQLRAAELYHKADAHERRNRIYVAWLDQGDPAAAPPDSDAHIRNQTMRQRLVAAGVEPRRYRAELVASEVTSQWHSDDTLAWAGRAAIELGEQEAARFAAVPLQHPLGPSLKRKQEAMAAARERFMQAEQLGGDTFRSEVLFHRAELYRQMADDLMASEAPAELNELETMQYQMLLEEEAYPFEEKAIRLHAENHQRLADGHFDHWVEQSLQVLAKLFSGRYDRDVRWMTWNEESNDGA